MCWFGCFNASLAPVAVDALSSLSWVVGVPRVQWLFYDRLTPLPLRDRSRAVGYYNNISSTHLMYLLYYDLCMNVVNVERVRGIPYVRGFGVCVDFFERTSN